MAMGLVSPIHSRLLRTTLIFLISFLLITTASFRLQSYLFDRKVRSVLIRMEKIHLDKTSKDEVLALVPGLKPGILWNFVVTGRPDDRCPADACYSLDINNWPDGILAALRQKLEYRHDWIFKTAYWLGHRFCIFRAGVEIRSGRVSRYEYSLSVEDAEFPAYDLVGVHVLGANRGSYPGGFGFIGDYDQIKGLRIEAPDNMPTKMMYVAFTPDAGPETVKKAFDVHLDCLWNTTGCSRTSQVLPALWQ